jgi:hypothetical protein
MKLLALLFAILIPTAGLSTELTYEEFTNYRDRYIDSHENHWFPYVREYFSTLQSMGSPNSEVSEWNQLRAEIQESEFVLMGDFHSIGHSQRNIVRVLEEMQFSERPTTLVIEWVNFIDRQYLMQFMRDEITEIEFKRSIRFDENWGFNWASHIQILSYCKREGIRVIAVDHRGIARPSISIEERDDLIVQRILFDRENRPNHQYLVVFGSAHIIGTQTNKHLYEKFQLSGNEPDLSIVVTSNNFYFSELENVLDDERIPVVQYSPQLFFLNIGLLFEPNASMFDLL